MKLRDLDPQFYGEPTRNEAGRVSYSRVDAITAARGIMFLCPKCFVANGGAVGTHRIMCWEPGVSTDIAPGPGRWRLLGSGYHDLSLVAGSSSILLTSGCRWHGFVQNGEVRDA